MFAIIKASGKQYKVAKNDIIKVDKIYGTYGDKVEFKEVLMVGDDTKPALIGTPLVKGVTVTATIINHYRDEKIIILKKKRRHNYRRKYGHQRKVTDLKIDNIIYK